MLLSAGGWQPAGHIQFNLLMTEEPRSALADALLRIDIGASQAVSEREVELDQLDSSDAAGCWWCMRGARSGTRH